MSLKEYQRKRQFDQTPEPAGKRASSKAPALRFVIQKHKATRLHFDFRLEIQGVLKSWAVPKGPSLDPSEHRLAVYVEDHPIEYGGFEGVIPKGNYGAGTVMIWDTGFFWERSCLDSSAEINAQAALDGLNKGHLTIVVHGHKISGEFALICLDKPTQYSSDPNKSWLLVKKRDQFSNYKRHRFSELSVKTGRKMEEITHESEKKGEIWLPKKKKQNSSALGWADPPDGAFNYFSTTPSRKPKKEIRFASENSPILKEIPDEKFPRRLKPMIPTRAPEAFVQKDWVTHTSHGGKRAIAEIDGNLVRLYSKQLLSFNDRFPKVRDALKKFSQKLVLDGELVKYDKNEIYYVFDLLHLNGKNYRVLPLSQRLKKLEKLKFFNSTIKKLKFKKDSKELLIRDLTSAYHAGTSPFWKKVTLKEKSKPKVNGISEHSTKVDAPAKVQLTHLDKIFWPEEKFTKGDLIEYYMKISKTILPYLKDKPQSMNRHPNGIFGEHFFQKNLTGHIPRYVKTTRIFSASSDRSIDYLLCQNKETLAYMINLGCIELNPWLANYQTPEHPDYLVIDLDPNGRPFNEVVEVANEFRRVLDLIKAFSCVKTSGSTGMHICIPTQGKYEFDIVRGFAEKVCEIVHREFEDMTSLERSPSHRRGKMYLDYMQNRRGQTLAAPYCARPKPGATVSTPLSWSEVRQNLNPAKFTIKTMPARLKQKGDLWRPMLKKSVNIPTCMSRLSKL